MKPVLWLCCVNTISEHQCPERCLFPTQQTPLEDKNRTIDRKCILSMWVPTGMSLTVSRSLSNNKCVWKTGEQSGRMHCSFLFGRDNLTFPSFNKVSCILHFWLAGVGGGGGGGGSHLVQYLTVNYLQPSHRIIYIILWLYCGIMCLC